MSELLLYGAAATAVGKHRANKDAKQTAKDPYIANSVEQEKEYLNANGEFNNPNVYGDTKTEAQDVAVKEYSKEVAGSSASKRSKRKADRQAVRTVNKEIN